MSKLCGTDDCDVLLRNPMSKTAGFCVACRVDADREERASEIVREGGLPVVVKFDETDMRKAYTPITIQAPEVTTNNAEPIFYKPGGEPALVPGGAQIVVSGDGVVRVSDTERQKRYTVCKACRRSFDRRTYIYNPPSTANWPAPMINSFKCVCGCEEYLETDDLTPEKKVAPRKREPRANYRKLRVM